VKLRDPVAHSHQVTHLGALAAEVLRWKRAEEGPGIPVAVEVENRG